MLEKHETAMRCWFYERSRICCVSNLRLRSFVHETSSVTVVVSKHNLIYNKLTKHYLRIILGANKNSVCFDINTRLVDSDQPPMRSKSNLSKNILHEFHGMISTGRIDSTKTRNRIVLYWELFEKMLQIRTRMHNWPKN